MNILIPTLLRPDKGGRHFMRARTLAVAQKGPPVERLQGGMPKIDPTPSVRTRATAPLFNVNGGGKEGNAMKRQSLRKYGNSIGCVLLWIAVVRPDRRTALEWLRVAIREHERKSQLQ